MKRSFTRLILVFLTQLAFSQTPSARIEWQTGMYGSYVGSAGIVPADLDGDQKNEFITSGRADRQGFNPSDYFYVLGHDPGQNRYVIKWMSRVFFEQINAIAVHNFNQQQGPEVFIGFKDGTIKVFDGIHYQEIHSFKIPSAKTDPYFPRFVTRLNWIEFGDADNDGATDLVVSDGAETFIYNSAYQLAARIPYGAPHFKVGDIDGDAKKEIVFSNGTVVQTSSGSAVLEQRFTQGSRVETDKVALSDVNQDNVADIVYSREDSLCTFDARNKKRIWGIKWAPAFGYYPTITALALGDYNNDQVADVLVGNLSDGAPECFDGKTGARQFTMYAGFNVSHGVGSLAVANLDPDVSPELVYASGTISSAADIIHVHNLSDQRQEWQSTHLDGPFHAFDYGDVDNDNRMELVIASLEGDSGYEHGYIQVYDAETYELKWQSPRNLFDHSVDQITMVKVRDIDEDGKNELLVGVGYSYAVSHLYVLDAGYQVSEYLSVTGMNQILDLVTADLDADGQREVVIATGTNVSGSTHPEAYINRIHVYDAKTKQLKWQSEQMGGVATRTFSLRVGNIDQDEAKEVVAVMQSEAYGVKSKLVMLDGKDRTTWTDDTYDYRAVDLVDWNGDRQQEIVAATDSGKIVFLNGVSLAVDSVLTTPSGRINALQAFDVDRDGKQELVYTDHYTVNLYSFNNKRVYWQSDTISNRTGSENRLAVGNFDKDPLPEILLDGYHTFLKFELDTSAAGQKINQAIRFDAIGTKTAATSFTLSAVATSALPVGYRLTSVPAGIASLAGNVVTLTDGGQVTITAFQNGNEKYNPAPEVVLTFQVEKALGIEEELAKKVRVYPVPATEYLIVEFPPALSESTYDLFNYRGQPVAQGEVNGQGTVRVGIAALAGGLHVLRIRNAKHSVTKKVMIGK